MPYEFAWYERNNIVLETYSDNVTPEEILATLQQSLNWLGISENTLHFIIDWRNVTTTPNLFLVRTEILQLLRHKHTGFYAIVGMTPALAFWVQVFTRASGLQAVSCNSIEDAADFLRQIMATA